MTAIRSTPSPAQGVPIPTALLTDDRIGPQAKLLFGQLQLLPAFRHPAGQFSYEELANLTGASRNTLEKALIELAGAKWIAFQRANRLARIDFTLGSPVEAYIERARHRLGNARFYGEALMREYLSLLIDSENFKDNASPDFLINPQTGEALELDRFYPPGVAFEFNGPQHYRATQRYTAADATKQRSRDYIKLGICVSRGIALVTVHPDDLSIEPMLQKIGRLLPLRDLTWFDPLVDLLEAESRDYRRWLDKL